MPAMQREFATDYSTLLGAESFIKGINGAAPSDPYGAECLRHFVDLFLNSDVVYIPVPTSLPDDNPVSQWGPYLQSQVFRVPPMKGSLKEAVEQDVVHNFMQLLNSNDFSKLGEWLPFQLRNQLVTEAHKFSVMGGMISVRGYELWDKHRQDIFRSTPLGRASLLPISKLPKKLRDNLEKSKPDGASWAPGDFLACYVFDTFWRGWEYMLGIGADKPNSAYVPHPLRTNALRTKNLQWTGTLLEEAWLWSWGEYFVNMLQAPEYKGKRSPRRVMELMLRIRNEEAEAGWTVSSRWRYREFFDESGELIHKSDLEDAQNRILQIAKRAKLPLLPKRDSFVKAANAVIDLTTAPATTVVDPLLTAGIELSRLIIESAPRENAVTERLSDLEAEYHAAKYRGLSLIRKAEFDYIGLVRHKAGNESEP
jgi:hypothetical protein